MQVDSEQILILVELLEPILKFNAFTMARCLDVIGEWRDFREYALR